MASEAANANGEPKDTDGPGAGVSLGGGRRRWLRWDRNVGIALVAVLVLGGLGGTALARASWGTAAKAPAAKALGAKAPAAHGPAAHGPAAHAPAAHGPAAHAPAAKAPAAHGPAAKAPAFSQTGPFVALGDSFASGNLIPHSPAGHPLGCLRSTHTYSADAAAALHVSAFVDASCSGAYTVNITQPQGTPLGTNPAQLASVSAKDSVVTVTIGGNDIGFGSILVACTTLSLTDPFGSPCHKHYGNRLATATAATAPKVAAALREIRAKAPKARVLLVGYPDILPNTGTGCWPRVPIAHGDVPYLRATEVAANNMLATVAAAEHVTFVGTYRATIGHDACQSHDVKDVEGLIPTSPAEPFHPNERGEQVMANQVLAALRH